MLITKKYNFLLMACMLLTSQISFAESTVRCIKKYKNSDSVSHPSYINFAFESALLKTKGSTGVSSFINFNIDHLKIVEGELISHFRSNLNNGELEWVRYSESIFDVRIKVAQSIYQVRLSPKGPWPQKIALLFSYSPSPNIGIQKVTDVQCTQEH